MEKTQRKHYKREQALTIGFTWESVMFSNVNHNIT